jgi:hypothetical protein
MQMDNTVKGAVALGALIGVRLAVMSYELGASAIRFSRRCGWYPRLSITCPTKMKKGTCAEGLAFVASARDVAKCRW